MFNVNEMFQHPHLGRLDKSGQELALAFFENLGKSQQIASDSAVTSLRKHVEELGKSNPLPNNVHISQELANVMIGYFQRDAMFVAGSDSRMPVDFKTGSYHVMDIGDLYRQENGTARAPGREAPSGGFRKSTASYTCERHAWKQPVWDETAAQQAVGDPAVQAAMYVAQILKIKRENMWVTNLFGTGIWTGDQTGVASSPSTNQFLQWNDAAATPRTNLSGYALTVHERTGFAPNRLYLQPHVLRHLLLNPEVVDAFKHTVAGATPTLEGLAAALFANGIGDVAMVPQIRVIGGVQNTAAEGATASISYIAGKAALLAYVDPNPSLYTPTAYLNFQWVASELGGAGNSGIIAKRFTHPERAIITEVEGEFFLIQKVVAPSLGLFMASAVA